METVETISLMLGAAWASGINLYAAILVLGGIRVALPLPLWANLALTIFWVVGITNAFNLLDNMDGLASGVGAVAAVTMAALAFTHGQLPTALAAAARQQKANAEAEYRTCMSEREAQQQRWTAYRHKQQRRLEDLLGVAL